MRKFLFYFLLVSQAVCSEDLFKVDGIKVRCDCDNEWKTEQLDTNLTKKLNISAPKKLFIKNTENKKDAKNVGALGETRTPTS